MGGHARKHIVIYALYQPSFFYCRRRKQKKASSQREDERHSSLTQDHVTCMRFRPGHTNQGQITSCPSLVAPPFFYIHFTTLLLCIFFLTCVPLNIISLFVHQYANYVSRLRKTITSHIPSFNCISANFPCTSQQSPITDPNTKEENIMHKRANKLNQQLSILLLNALTRNNRVCVD